MSVLDVGCGSGDFTLELHRRLGARETLGIEPSERMLVAARARNAPGIRFEKGDINALGELELPSGLDLVFSNGAFQYVKDRPATFKPASGGFSRPAG